MMIIHSNRFVVMILLPLATPNEYRYATMSVQLVTCICTVENGFGSYSYNKKPVSYCTHSICYAFSTEFMEFSLLVIPKVEVG